MDVQRERPPAYTQHEPETLNLPSVPTHAPNAQQHNDRLPGIRALDLPDSIVANPHHRSASTDPSSRATFDQPQWGSLPPLNSATFPRVPDGLPRTSNEVDVGSPMDTASIASVQDDASRRREMSVLSVDDPDVRLAAEALSGLGNPDFARSPTSRSLTVPRSPTASAEPEPLLSLITSNHPWLGGTINGSMSAYNATKNYSPRFVKYGAELIERNIGSPMVNTVSSVGRRTGVEQNLRRYLGEMGRRPSDLEQGDSDAARKRQRVTSPTADAMEVDEAFASPRTRGGSQSSYAESLPAYDDHRSPKYEETAVVAIDSTSGKGQDSQSAAVSQQDRRVNWSTQLIMTTSGLGVALSDASLKSLKICLGLLRSATKHIDDVMRALKSVLDEYESALQSRRRTDNEAGPPSEKMDITLTNGDDTHQEEQVRLIASRMKKLSNDIWTTLQTVVQSVSRYTGGALPQNASQVVRTQLLSVPQRWQSASRESAAEGEDARGEDARGARRMLAFAREGVDMMGQITHVVDGTVQSAETWLARVGRKPQEQENGQGSTGQEKMALVEVQVREKS